MLDDMIRAAKTGDWGYVAGDLLRMAIVFVLPAIILIGAWLTTAHGVPC